jgi:uncharacterized protein YndB with AHSA1/START domain
MMPKKELAITAEPGKQEMYVIREFDAPRELVFEAFTDPELLIKWLGPKRFTMSIDYYDARSGGAYRYIHTDDKGNSYSFRGVIHEIHAPEIAIQTFEFEGLPEKGHVTLDTAIFEILPNDRTKLTIHSVFRSNDDRDAAIRSGMEKGIAEGFSRLDDLLPVLKEHTS